MKFLKIRLPIFVLCTCLIPTRVVYGTMEHIVCKADYCYQFFFFSFDLPKLVPSNMMVE